MKNFKSIFVFTFLIMIVGYSYGQGNTETVIYKTYEDFKNKKGKSIGKIINYAIGVGHAKLKPSSGKSISIKGYWGFTVGDVLFRMRKNDFVKVGGVGKLVYYEHGTASLSMILNDVPAASIDATESMFYYSATLTSEMYNSLNKYKKRVENPDEATIKLFNCLKSAHKTKKLRDEIKAVRKCIESLN